MSTLSLSMALVAWVLLTLIFADLFVSYKRNSYAKGTHQRYVWTTIHKLFIWSILIVAPISAIGNIALGQYVTAAMNIFVFVIELLNKNLEDKRDEDNWFKGRGKKIWKSVKNFVATKTSQLVPVTSGA